MPVINTSREDLHNRLKHELIGKDKTIAKAVELYIEFCLDLGVLRMTEEQRQQIINLVGKKGLSILEDSQKGK